MFHASADSPSQVNGQSVAHKGEPIADHIRFNDQPRIQEEDPTEVASDSSSTNVEGESTDGEWSPRLLPHETGLSEDTEIDPPTVRRSSSCPSLLVFEWKPSSAFANEGEDEDMVQWNLEIENPNTIQAQLQPPFPAELDDSHFGDEVDPFCEAGPLKEPKRPSEKEVGITWSNLTKINNKLVHWSFGGDEGQQPASDSTYQDLLSELSVTASAAQKTTAPAPTSHSAQPQQQPQSAKSTRSRPAIKTARFAPTPEKDSTTKRSDPHSGGYPTVPCFRGLRDSIAIARSRSQPKSRSSNNNKNSSAGGGGGGVADQIDPALLLGMQERIRLINISENPRTEVPNPTPTTPNAPPLGLCCLTMTGLESKAEEQRQDSVSVTSSPKVVGEVKSAVKLPLQQQKEEEKVTK